MTETLSGEVLDVAEGFIDGGLNICRDSGVETCVALAKILKGGSERLRDHTYRKEERPSRDL